MIVFVTKTLGRRRHFNFECSQVALVGKLARWFDGSCVQRDGPIEMYCLQCDAFEVFVGDNNREIFRFLRKQQATVVFQILPFVNYPP